jgi:hypothetical protein
MAGYLAHSREDSLIGDTAGFNLAYDHFFALAIEFCRLFIYHARHPVKTLRSRLTAISVLHRCLKTQIRFFFYHFRRFASMDHIL